MSEEEENSIKSEEQNEGEKEGTNRRQVTLVKKQKHYSEKLRITHEDMYVHKIRLTWERKCCPLAKVTEAKPERQCSFKVNR
jgi:hypothetical protein